jgi:hypothetical protein
MAMCRGWCRRWCEHHAELEAELNLLVDISYTGFEQGQGERGAGSSAAFADAYAVT